MKTQHDNDTGTLYDLICCQKSWKSQSFKKETYFSLFTEWVDFCLLCITLWCLQKVSACWEKKTVNRKVIFNRSQSVCQSQQQYWSKLPLSVQGFADCAAESTEHCGKRRSVSSGHFFLLTLGFLTGRRYGLSIMLSSLAFVEGTTPLGGSMEFSLSAPGSSCRNKCGSKQQCTLPCQTLTSSYQTYIDDVSCCVLAVCLVVLLRGVCLLQSLQFQFRGQEGAKIRDDAWLCCDHWNQNAHNCFK